MAYVKNLYSGKINKINAFCALGLNLHDYDIE